MNVDLEFEPRLVEEAVLLALKRRPRQGALHRERDAAYAVADAEKRDLAFLEIHARWFRSLRLAGPVTRAIREAGEALSGVSRWLVASAVSERRSGAELFVDVETRRAVVLRIVPATLADGARALAFLRRELLFIADMLDPRFEYQPRLPRSPLGPPEDRRIQDRYAALWRCSVVGRLVGAGKLPEEHRRVCFADFHVLFACLGDDAQACFEIIFSDRRPLHSVLVALATEPEVAFGVRQIATERRRRCPLCGFPTGDFDPDVTALPQEVQSKILLDFPSWSVEQSLCRQCGDLYRSLPAADSSDSSFAAPSAAADPTVVIHRI